MNERTRETERGPRGVCGKGKQDRAESNERARGPCPSDLARWTGLSPRDARTRGPNLTRWICQMVASSSHLATDVLPRKARQPGFAGRCLDEQWGLRCFSEAAALWLDHQNLIMTRRLSPMLRIIGESNLLRTLARSVGRTPGLAKESTSHVNAVANSHGGRTRRECRARQKELELELRGVFFQGTLRWRRSEEFRIEQL